MSQSRRDVALQFWSGERRADQMFYVAFCILSTALTDYAAARELEESRKYDWAIVAYYYAMVHSARLLCFVTVGDFPKRHDSLYRLFKEPTEEVGGDSWLKSLLEDFLEAERADKSNECTNESSSVRNRGENEYQQIMRNLGSTQMTHADVVEGLEGMGFENPEESVRFLGDLLMWGKKLREKVNYEGLLAAHQRSHRYMTRRFREGARLMRSAASEAIQLAVDGFCKFVERSDHRGLRRGEWWVNFLLLEKTEWGYWRQGLNYLKDSLREKVQDPEILDEAMSFLEPINQLGRSLRMDPGMAREVFNNISYDIFGVKRGIMKLFSKYVRCLKKSLESSGRSRPNLRE